MSKTKAALAGLYVTAILIVSFVAVDATGVFEAGGKPSHQSQSPIDVQLTEHNFTENSIQLFDQEFNESVMTGEGPQVERGPSSVAPPENEAADRSVNTMEKLRQRQQQNMIQLIIDLNQTASEMDQNGLLDDMIFGFDQGIIFGLTEDTLEQATLATVHPPVAHHEPDGPILHEYEDIDFDEQVADALRAASKEEFDVAKVFAAEISEMTAARLQAEIGLDAFDSHNELLIKDFRQHFLQEEGDLQISAGNAAIADEAIGFADIAEAAQEPGADTEQALNEEQMTGITGGTEQTTLPQ